MRWIKTAGGLLLLMGLMASCIRLEASIKIEDDGSGSVDFLSALNIESFTGVLGGFDIPESQLGDTAELCNEFNYEFSPNDELPDGATITPYDEEGFCGTRIQYDLAASTDQSANVTELFDASTRLYKEGDNWFLDSDVNTDDMTSLAGDVPPDIFAELFADASITITVDLPGRAVEGQNNATEVSDDGKFTWDIDLLDPQARIFAQTEPGSDGGSGSGSGSRTTPLLIVAIVAALAAAIGLFLWKRKNDAVAPAVEGSAQSGIGPAGVSVPPAADPIEETVATNAADIQQPIQDSVTDSGDDEAPAATNHEPVFDQALNAWVVEDPARGRLRHDPATDTWNPV